MGGRPRPSLSVRGIEIKLLKKHPVDGSCNSKADIVITKYKHYMSGQCKHITSEQETYTISTGHDRVTTRPTSRGHDPTLCRGHDRDLPMAHAAHDALLVPMVVDLRLMRDHSRL